MDQYRSRLKLSESFERHWSILISGEIHMDQFRNAIRANRFARIIRNWHPYFYSASGRFAWITRISDSRVSPDSRDSRESIRANHATKFCTLRIIFDASLWHETGWGSNTLAGCSGLMGDLHPELHRSWGKDKETALEVIQESNGDDAPQLQLSVTCCGRVFFWTIVKPLWPKNLQATTNSKKGGASQTFSASLGQWSFLNKLYSKNPLKFSQSILEAFRSIATLCSAPLSLSMLEKCLRSPGGLLASEDGDRHRIFPIVLHRACPVL